MQKKYLLEEFKKSLNKVYFVFKKHTRKILILTFKKLIVKKKVFVKRANFKVFSFFGSKFFVGKFFVNCAHNRLTSLTCFLAASGL